MSHNGMIKATWTEVLGLTWKCMEAGEMRAVLQGTEDRCDFDLRAVSGWTNASCLMFCGAITEIWM